jgi:hypothetical protein
MYGLSSINSSAHVVEAYNNTPSIVCSTSESFRVDVGELFVVGVSPVAQHRTCVSGRLCVLDGIVGHGLSTGDRLAVLDTCSKPRLISRFAMAGALSLRQNRDFAPYEFNASTLGAESDSYFNGSWFNVSAIPSSG